MAGNIKSSSLLAVLLVISTLQVVISDCVDEFINCHQYSQKNDGDFVKCNMCVCTEGCDMNLNEDLYNCFYSASDTDCKAKLMQAWIIGFVCIAFFASLLLCCLPIALCCFMGNSKGNDEPPVFEGQL